MMAECDAERAAYEALVAAELRAARCRAELADAEAEVAVLKRKLSAEKARKWGHLPDLPDGGRAVAAAAAVGPAPVPKPSAAAVIAAESGGGGGGLVAPPDVGAAAGAAAAAAMPVVVAGPAHVAAGAEALDGGAAGDAC